MFGSGIFSFYESINEKIIKDNCFFGKKEYNKKCKKDTFIQKIIFVRRCLCE